MPFLLIAKNWALSNWKPILLALAVAAIFFVGYRHGASAVQAEWDAYKLEHARAVETDRARRQAASDATDIETIRNITSLQNTVNNLLRSLSHETLNPAYRCKPTADGLRQLNEVRAAARTAASQRHD